MSTPTLQTSEGFRFKASRVSRKALLRILDNTESGVLRRSRRAIKGATRLNCGRWNLGASVSDSPTIRILRGHECKDDPCSALQELAAQNYGSSSALPVSLLRSWYEENPSIFRIAVTSDNSVVGYISTLPILANIFNRTIDPDFQESIITAEDIDTSLCPSDGGIFLSSIVVATEYQKQSSASLLLRLTLIEDLISECSAENQTVRISAQALSVKGEACMRSLGMNARGFTTAGWRVYYGKLDRAALYSRQGDLQRKFATRFKQAGDPDISNERI